MTNFPSKPKIYLLKGKGTHGFHLVLWYQVKRIMNYLKNSNLDKSLRMSIDPIGILIII